MLTIGINDDCDDDNDVHVIFLNEMFNDDNIWWWVVCYINHKFEAI